MSTRIQAYLSAANADYIAAVAEREGLPASKAVDLVVSRARYFEQLARVAMQASGRDQMPRRDYDADAL